MAGEDFFDATFLAELEELAQQAEPREGGAAAVEDLHEKLSAFLAPGGGSAEALTEEAFAALPAAQVAERTNALIEICRDGGVREAAQAVESFIVFFQTLVPTLSEEGARQIKRLFFHLVPSLIQIAHADFGVSPDRSREGHAALRSVETILIEISSVRLTPTEGDLVSRSIDQLGALIGAGEYAMADQVVSSQLLGIIARNKLARTLYRLMEVEVSIQTYLKAKLGHSTPRIRIPDDLEKLADYGPLRVLHEESAGGAARRLIQVHLPDLHSVRDVVLHLQADEAEPGLDLRLDALGTAELAVPDGTYRLGLVYQPREGREGSRAP